jgi:hypothetical protein
VIIGVTDPEELIGEGLTSKDTPEPTSITFLAAGIAMVGLAAGRKR